MNKEIISDSQAISMIILFVFGSTIILGTGNVANNDIWIANILAITTALPIALIYSRVLSLYKGMDIYDILQILFGKIIGKVIIILYTWYAFHLGAMVLRSFGEFINTAALPETPIFVPLLLLGILCIMATKAGVEVLGRSAKFFLPIIIITIVLTDLLSIPEFHLNFLKPVLYNGFSPVINNAFINFSFPFAETVLFTCIFFSLNKKSSPYKVYLLGILISGIFIIDFSVRNILVIGTIMESKSYFPSYEALRRITISNFLQRIEVFATNTFVITAFIKASVCLLAVCNGICKTFGLKSYRSIVVQTGLIMIFLSYFIYDNIVEMKTWGMDIYCYYALPFQVIFPLIIFVFAEIKLRVAKK